MSTWGWFDGEIFISFWYNCSWWQNAHGGTFLKSVSYKSTTNWFFSPYLSVISYFWRELVFAKYLRPEFISRGTRSCANLNRVVVTTSWFFCSNYVQKNEVRVCGSMNICNRRTRHLGTHKQSRVKNNRALYDRKQCCTDASIMVFS